MPPKKNMVNKGKVDVSSAVEHDALHGMLDKKNRKGKWDTRFFRLTDEHLSYYANESSKTAKAAIDLRHCHGISVKEGLEFSIEQDNHEPYDLRISSKSKNGPGKAEWVAGLRARIKTEDPVAKIETVPEVPLTPSTSSDADRESLITSENRSDSSPSVAKPTEANPTPEPISTGPEETPESIEKQTPGGNKCCLIC